MPKIQLKEKNNPMEEESASGFLGGLNTFQDENLLKDNELTEAKNIILSVDGLEPRPGTLAYGDNNSESRIFGIFPAVFSNGTRELLRASGGKLYKYTTGTWTQIGSTTWNATARMNFVQARDRVYMFNGVDALSYYDGTSITTYTALTTPVGLAVAATGGTGSTAYSYRVSAFNAVGETLAAAGVAIANGVATLSPTTYNAVTWTAVGSAVGYNVYGRKATGLGETYLATVYTNAYNDTGDANPSNVVLPPEGNSTTGVIAQKAVFAISRIFAAGDPSKPSRLYYGGLGSNIGNFSFSETGGGATDIFLNDGQVIRDILPFQGGVIVWKDRAIYKFSFTSAGEPQVEEITRSFGGIAWRGSQHVENDVIFPTLKDGRLAFYSLGNQENYSAGVLRTNELSIKVAKGTVNGLENIDPSKLQYAAAFYFNNIYGCAITQSGGSVNNRIWCLDTRFGAWTYWDNLSPNCFTVFSDSSQQEKLYYGDDVSGYVQQMFYTTNSDNGVAYEVEWATKSFNQKRFNKIKKYYNPVYQYKDVQGNVTINVEIIKEGAEVYDTIPITLSQASTGGGGIGAFLPGFHLAGDSPNSVIVTTDLSSDTYAEIVLHGLQARAIKYRMSITTAGAKFKFLSFAHLYKILENKRLKSTNRFYS